MVTNQELFTKMFITNNESIYNIASWLLNEVNKTELPQMPFEMWYHIVSFVPKEKRNDAVILGNNVIIVSYNNTMFNLLSEKMFIRQYGSKEIEKIHRKTFGSTRENDKKAMELYSGRIQLNTILEMP